jgi:hypothetical protein
VDESEGAKNFFNFSNGSGEGPQSIAQLADFMDRLRAQPGANVLAGRLRDAARSYVASALVKAGRSGEGQNLSPKLLQDFLRTNAPWMRRSGLFTAPQVNATNQLLDYLGMLRRPEQLLRQVNSATHANISREKTFIDEIMNPWGRKLVELAGLGLGGEHGGGLGAIAMGAVGNAFEDSVLKAEIAMRGLMAQALLDPRVAQGLMMKATAANRAMLSPQARQIIDTARAAIGSDILPQLTAPGVLPQAVQVGR